MISNIAKGAVISYISIFINILLTFVYTPWMINKIGMSDYGLYSLVLTFLAYFLMDFGLSKSIIRFIAKYRAEGDENKISNMIGMVLKIYLCIDIFIFITLLVVYPFLTNIFTGLTILELDKLKILFCISGLFSILNFIFKPISGIMNAYEYFVEVNILNMIQRLGTVLLIFLVLLCGGDVYDLVLINGSVALSVSVVKYITFKRKSKISVNWSYFDKKEAKKLYVFSFWAFLISFAQQLRMNMMPTILGITADTAEISVFTVGRTIEGFIFTITFALNGLFLPKVSKLLQEKNKDQISNLMIRVGRIQLFIIFCVITGFIIFGESFINLWIGNNFKDSYYILILLVIPEIVSLTQTIADDIIFANNNVKYSASLILLTSFLSFLLAVPFSIRIGALGCAYAIFIGACLYLFLINLFYNNKLKLPLLKFFKECHFKILPLLSTLAFISFLLWNFFGRDSWITLSFGIILYVIVYTLISYFVLLKIDEKELVKNVLHLGR